METKITAIKPDVILTTGRPPITGTGSARITGVGGGGYFPPTT